MSNSFIFPAFISIVLSFVAYFYILPQMREKWPGLLKFFMVVLSVIFFLILLLIRYITEKDPEDYIAAVLFGKFGCEYITKNLCRETIKITGISSTLKACDECPPMTKIPSISSPELKINAFNISKHEISFDNWQDCVNEKGCISNIKPDDNEWGRGKRPVINVSYKDALEYTRWLSKRKGAKCRLPSEGEWEYAARADSKGTYFWGERALPKQANYRISQYKNGKTQVVSSYEANRWHLYNVHGNIQEWTSTCEDGNCKKRIVKGGSWSSEPQDISFSSRHAIIEDTRHDQTGFRVICNIKNKKSDLLDFLN